MLNEHDVNLVRGVAAGELKSKKEIRTRMKTLEVRLRLRAHHSKRRCLCHALIPASHTQTYQVLMARPVIRAAAWASDHIAMDMARSLVSTAVQREKSAWYPSSWKKCGYLPLNFYEHMHHFEQLFMPGPAPIDDGDLAQYEQFLKKWGLYDTLKQAPPAAARICLR